MQKKIKIIDLFAGPGGLGEGFSNCKKNSPYEIAMSVEADRNAHKTLTHRAFYRKLDKEGKSRFLDYIQTTDKEAREIILNDLKEDIEHGYIRTSDEFFRELAIGHPLTYIREANELEV